MSEESLTKFFPFSPASIWPKTPRTPKLATPSRKSRKRKTSESQTILDAGQSKIGLDCCSECGMTYNVDHEDDIKLHNEYHNRHNSTKPLQVRSIQVESWKKHVKFVKTDKPLPGTLFVITSDTKCPSIRKKVDEVIKEYVNVEIGFCDDVPTWRAKRTILLFVTSLEHSSKTQFIAGIALADSVEKVYLEPDKVQLKIGNYVGINRLWVHQAMRRKGLATFLTNASRPLVYPGVSMAETRAAFYEPSNDGLKFVLAYFGQQKGRYLTYDDE